MNNIKESAQYKQLEEVLEVIKELQIPDHLQECAFQHLLSGTSPHPSKPDDEKRKLDANGLREFMGKLTTKGAVAEIPALLYWMKENEEKDKANEREIVELYRRAGIRPPKNVSQSFRDLSSKKYLRLESVKGEPGYFRLSRTGEDIVRFDLIPSQD